MRSLAEIERDNSRVLVVGIDPGLAHLGWARVLIRSSSEELVGLGVFASRKSDKKRNILGADDNVRRARELAKEISKVLGLIDLGEHDKQLAMPRVVCAETMAFLRGASATAKLHLAWGVLVGRLESNGLPLVQASPQEVKVAACGRRDASKADVLEAMRKRFTRVDRYLNEIHPAGDREHAVDALAVVVACLESEVVRLARPR